jgi:TolB-like protein
MTAVYGAVGFGVLQAVEAVVPALLLPDWTYRFIAVLILAGFPIALALAWSLERAPEGLRLTRPAQAGELEGIVNEPRIRRWPSGLLAGAGIVLLTSAAWWTLMRPVAPGAETTQSSRPIAEDDLIVSSIAVLPFLDLSPGGTMAYFGDGMAEEILNVLAQVPELKVSGRTSSFSFREEAPNIQEIGRALGVAHILEGGVRLAGETLRVTAQLVRTEDQYHAWPKNFDETFSAEEIFRIQDQIAGEIAEQLRVSLGLAERRGADRRPPTENTGAYQLYLEGRHLLYMRTDTSIVQSIERFSSALDLDPGFAVAAAGLAAAYYVVPGYASVDYETQALAEQYARAALELEPRLAEAHAVLGSLLRDEREWSEATAAYERALKIEPRNPGALLWFAGLELALGRLDRGLALLERAYDVDPGSGVISGWLAHAHRVRGDLDQAVRFIDQAAERGWGVAPLWACRTYMRRGPMVDIIAGCRDTQGFSVVAQDFPDSLLAETLIRSGDRATAADSARTLTESIPISWAIGLGDLKLTTAYLEEMMTRIEAGDGSRSYGAPNYLDVWAPDAANLRADPAFHTWVEWMGMDDAWRETGWPASCQPVGEGFICR